MNIHLREGESFIRLGQAMKKAGLADSGAAAGIVISNGAVSVNGEVETRRGRKMYPGDAFVFEDTSVLVVQ